MSPKPTVPMSRRHPLGPRLTINVTSELINTSIRNNSSHCMIAEAMKIAAPELTRVAVDISTCRGSDLEKGLRYVWLTPRAAQDALVDFDEGLAPKPFSFLLKNAHVSRAGHPQTSQKEKSPSRRRRPTALPSRAKLVTGRRGIPTRVGGKRPPQLHTRREFGLRAFRAASLNRLKAEAQEQEIETATE